MCYFRDVLLSQSRGLAVLKKQNLGQQKLTFTSNAQILYVTAMPGHLLPPLDCNMQPAGLILTTSEPTWVNIAKLLTANCKGILEV